MNDAPVKVTVVHRSDGYRVFLEEDPEIFAHDETAKGALSKLASAHPDLVTNGVDITSTHAKTA